MQINKYEQFLQSVFSSLSTCKSGQELNQLLMEKFNIKPVSARKIIQRATEKGVIKSSDPITFGKNQFIYFNPRSNLNIHKIMKLSKKYRPPLYRLLSLIELNGGIVSYFEASKVTASPRNSKKMKESKTKVSSLQDLLYILKFYGIVEETSDSFENKYIISTVNTHEKQSIINSYYTKMELDGSFITAIIYWLVKQNLIDNQNFRFRNKKDLMWGAVHNNISWDAFAYTKTTGFNTVLQNSQKSDDKSTLVVLDLVVNRDYTEIDLDGFYSRIQIVRNSVKSGLRKILPIVAYCKASDVVIKKMNALGFLHFDIKTIYSDKIQDIIASLEFINENRDSDTVIYDSFTDNIEKTLSLLKETGQETNLGNIKGDLFEALIHIVISFKYPGTDIQWGKTLQKSLSDGKKESYEYDLIVVASRFQEVIIFELKGYKTTYEIQLGDTDTKNSVKWFFRKTFPFAQKIYNEQNNYTSKAYYITSAHFSQDALKFLKKLNTSKLKPEKLDIYYDGRNLLNLLEIEGLGKIRDIIKKYYIDKKAAS